MKIGDTVGPYRITGSLGVGGMGEVFRARDARLERDVALKFVAGGLDTPELRGRLVREARAASSLNHKNICTIYEIGEHEGRPFIAMECLEGETLSARLMAGPIEAAAIPELALQTADALGAAHERGIIHRDLKPGNIFLTRRGDVKILDFGLATIEEGPSRGFQAPLTAEGMTVGTTMYMSPEQARGEKLDGRSDLFALGVVMYEMATGRNAFARFPLALTLTALLTEQPEPILRVNPSAPPAVVPIVDRLLAKNAADRYQTAGEVVEALRALRRPSSPMGSESRRRAVARPVPTLAVLPFANRSSDPANEYLSDGVTEEIMNTLGKLPNLRVAARASSFAFKGKTPELAEVGAKLKASMVLSGSVQRAGARVRIIAQLVNVDDGAQLWSERYDREADDVFAIQDDIAGSIADHLKIELDSVASAREGTSDLEAYHLYLQGRYQLNQRGPGILRGIELFERALARDAGYAAAHAALGESRALLAFYGFAEPRRVMPLARQDVERALAIDPELADARATLGFIHYTYGWNAEAGRRELERALAINPSYVGASMWLGILAGTVDGRFDEAVTQCRRANALDPLSAVAAAMLVNALLIAGRYDAAEEAARHVLGAYPTYWLPRYYLGAAQIRLGRPWDAVATLEPAVEPSRRYGWLMSQLVEAYVGTGERDRALAIFKELLTGPAPQALPLAAAAAALGEMDTAFAWMELAFEARDVMSTLAHASLPPALRADPRFGTMMRRVADAKLD